MRQTSTVKRSPVKSSKTKNRIETPLEQSTSADLEFLRKVQEKAYQLYLARGCAHGYDVEDWLAAEQIVKGS